MLTNLLFVISQLHIRVFANEGQSSVSTVYAYIVPSIDVSKGASDDNSVQICIAGIQIRVLAKSGRRITVGEVNVCVVPEIAADSASLCAFSADPVLFGGVELAIASDEFVLGLVPDDSQIPAAVLTSVFGLVPIHPCISVSRAYVESVISGGLHVIDGARDSISLMGVVAVALVPALLIDAQGVNTAVVQLLICAFVDISAD